MNARAFASACGLLALVACYFALTGAHVALPQYLPVEHRVTMDVPPGAIGMDWYARAGAAFVAGLLGYAAGAAIAHRSERARRPRGAALVFGLAFGMLGWATLYIAFALATTPRQRHVQPAVPAPAAP